MRSISHTKHRLKIRWVTLGGGIMEK